MSCEHRRTHPSSCDDCGEPWCGVCVTYHRAGTVFECASKLRARVAELESELVTWKGIAKERGDRLAGDRAPPSVSTDKGEPRELHCEDCRRDYPVWVAPSELWNAVVRIPAEAAEQIEPFLCLTCFVLRAERSGIRPTAWVVRPEVAGVPVNIEAIRDLSGRPEAEAAAQRTSEALPGERERCARHCEVIANFVETGAGPIASPGARLRQAAENIRSGRPATLWLPEHQADPDYWIPTPKCGHGAQAFTFACDECGALPDGAKVHHPCPTEAPKCRQCGSIEYPKTDAGQCFDVYACARRQTEQGADMPRLEVSPTADDHELASGLVEERTNDASHHPRLIEDIANAIANARAEGARSDYPSHAAIGAGGGDEQSLAERAYVAHEEWLRQAFPDERPSPAEPWRDLDEREREVWRGTVMLVYQENAAAQLRSETPVPLGDGWFHRGWTAGLEAAIRECEDESDVDHPRDPESPTADQAWECARRIRNIPIVVAALTGSNAKGEE